MDARLAQRVVIEKHYMHRRTNQAHSISCGLYYGEVLVGVAIFGQPSNHNLLTGICGPAERLNVLELQRLWVSDAVPKNGESFFIQHCMRFVDKEIIISYADTTQGHLGIIYQAAGWLYVGLSDKHIAYRIVGEAQHKRKMNVRLGITTPPKTSTAR